MYFLTACAAERGGDALTAGGRARGLIGAAQHYSGLGRWFVRLFLVMPDHIHALLSFPPHGEMRKTVSAWKSFTAKETKVRWQRDFFEHRLRTGESFDVKADYIRRNPVRAKLCDDPGDWPHIWPR